MVWKKGQSGNPNGRRIKADDDWLPNENKEERQRRRTRERAATWRQTYPDRTKDLALIGRARRDERWEAFLQSERERYGRGKDRILERQKAARKVNPEPSRLANRRCRKKYPHKGVAACAHYRARKCSATPAWVDQDEITAIYAEARRVSKETGERHEVDHIYPLKGRDFTGLHVPWNLQVLSKEENARKFNRPPETWKPST